MPMFTISEYYTKKDSWDAIAPSAYLAEKLKERWERQQRGLAPVDPRLAVLVVQTDHDAYVDFDETVIYDEEGEQAPYDGPTYDPAQLTSQAQRQAGLRGQLDPDCQRVHEWIWEYVVP